MALTYKEAAIVLGMAARGDKKHDIAAWFGENQARVAEVEAGEFGTLALAPAAELPPKGAPGPKGRRLRGFTVSHRAGVSVNRPVALGTNVFSLGAGAGPNHRAVRPHIRSKLSRADSNQMPARAGRSQMRYG